MQKSQLGEAFIPIRAMLDMLDKDLDAARGKVTSNLDKIKKNLEVAGVGVMSGIGVATTAVAALGAAMGKLAIDAAPMEGISAAFDGIATAAGSGMDEMLSALQKGSNGMIDNRNLMMSFNKAAQLVGEDFAVQLPDAMKYLGKVSAATGQDMGYMMDSLVVGVGRLSPMILDNLGIQVKLSDATERAAQMYGVEAEELTKAQQQAGMMSVVLEKLEANTAAMPDVTETASAKLAQFKTSMKNAKEEIGMAFLPVLKVLLDTFARMFSNIMPKVQAAFDKIAPVIETVAIVISDFIAGIESGRPFLVVFTEAMYDLFPPDIANEIVKVVAGIQDFIDKVVEIMAPVADWIEQNVKLQDVLIAMAVAVGMVVLPMIWSLITALAPIIGTFLLVIAAAALLRAAWENDFLGIRTAATQLWEEKLLPMFEVLKEWLDVNLPIALAFLKDAWDNVLLPAIQAVWNWISGTLWPGFMAYGQWLTDVFTAIIATVSDIWTNVLWPAIQAVWDWMSTVLFPFFVALGEFFDAAFTLAITAMAGLWENVLLPAFQAVGDFLSATLGPVIEDLVTWFNDHIMPALETVGGYLGGAFKDALDGISEAIKSVTGWLKDMATKLSNIKLPDWLTPGSPTPFELGLVGISKQLRKLNATDLPSFRASLEFDSRDNIFGMNNQNMITGGNGGVTIENMNNYMNSGYDALQFSIDRAKAVTV